MPLTPDGIVRLGVAEDMALVGSSPPTNASDEAQVEAGALLQEMQVARSRNAMIKTLATREGRLVLHQIVELCGLNLCLADMSAGELAMAAGMRNVGLRVVAAIEASDPLGWIEIQRESKHLAMEDKSVADLKRKQLAERDVQ